MNYRGTPALLAAALWTFFGPPLAAQCTPDAYEEDDACIPSKTAVHGGDTQSRNFCEDAEDWINFNACEGRSYTIDANPTGGETDVALELFDKDCAGLLASHYGGKGLPASINWTAPASGTYHIKVLQFGGGFGDNHEYDLTLTGDTSPCATWMRTYGGARDDTVFSMQQTSDGGFIATGRSNSSGAGDDNCWVLKLGASGNIEWQKTYGGADFDAGYAVQQTSEGGFVVGGETQSYGAGGSEFWVLKLNALGAVEWQNAYGGALTDYFWFMEQTSDDGFVLAGVTYSFGAANADAWVLKLNALGGVEWENRYGSTDSDYALSVQQTSDDGYVVGGHTWSFGAGGNDFWILKLGILGNIEWQRAYGGASEDWGYFAQQTSDDGFVITGETESFGAGGGDLWVLRLIDQDNIQWGKTYGDLSDDVGWRIRQTSDDGFIVGGDTQSFGVVNRDFWTLKLAASGSVQWEKAHGGASEDIFWSPRELSDGGFASAGWVDSLGAGSFGAGLQDGWILKLDSGGNTDPSCTLGANTAAKVADTTATTTVTITTVTPEGTSAKVTDTSAASADSAAVINMQCTSTPYLEHDSHSFTDCGNADGVVDPGETITLGVTVQNVGVNNAAKVSGILSTATPGITISANSASFPDISVGSNGTSLTLFQFVVSSGVSCGTRIDFTLALSYEDGVENPFSNPAVFTVRVGSGTLLPPLLSEDFSEDLPGTWTVVDGGDYFEMLCKTDGEPNGKCLWSDLNPCSRDLLTGTFMIVDSDCAGPEFDMDEQLITPPIDCSSSKTVALQFDHNFLDYDFEVAAVKVRSANTGGAWVTIARFSKAPASGSVLLDITAEAAGAPDLQVNWHYYDAEYDEYWAVDNVLVEGVTFGCNPAVCGCGALPDEPSDDPNEPGAPPLEIVDIYGNQVDVQDESGSGANAYVVYENVLDQWYGTPMLDASCLIDAGGAAAGQVRLNYALGTLTGASDVWIVVSAANGCGESSCGADSDGTGRSVRPGWPAMGLCP